MFNRAAKEGIKAFVIVFVGIYVIASLVPSFGKEILGIVRFAGIMFYGEHNLLGTFSTSWSALLKHFLYSPMALVALLLPPVTLGRQGRKLTTETLSSDDAVSLFKRGSLVVVGYAPLALVGVPLLFKFLLTSDILFTVAISPVVFGGIGGISTKFW